MPTFCCKVSHRVFGYVKVVEVYKMIEGSRVNRENLVIPKANNSNIPEIGKCTFVNSINKVGRKSSLKKVRKKGKEVGDLIFIHRVIHYVQKN